MGVFSQLSIPWLDPAKTLFRLFSFFAFDLEFLKVSCVMGTDHVATYAFRQVLPILVPPIVAFALLMKLARRSGGLGRKKEPGQVRVRVEELGAQALNHSMPLARFSASSLSQFLSPSSLRSSVTSILALV
eukprot:2061924-Amphidinium_carterae.1